MMRTTQIPALVGLFVLGLSCAENDDGARVQIDLSGLVQHAAQMSVSFDAVTLKVLADDISPPIEQTVDPADLTFDLVVPAGLMRRFEVEASSAGTTVYWGEEIVEVLAPRTEINIEIDVFPGGSVLGTAKSCAGGGPTFDGATVVFTPVDPRPELPGPFSRTIAGGELVLPMATGTYILSGFLEQDGATLTMLETTLIVSQGQVSAVDLVFADSGATTADADALFALGQLRAAHASYLCAAAGDANDGQAHIGAAITRTLLLLEHPSVDTVMSTCGQPPNDAETSLFSQPDGLVPAFSRHRNGTHNLMIERRGEMEPTFSPVPLNPNIIMTEQHDGSSDINLSVIDFWVGPPVDDVFSFHIDINPFSPMYMNGAMFGPQEGDLHFNVEVGLEVEDIFEEEENFDPMMMSPGPPSGHHVHCPGGFIHIDSAGRMPGESFAITFNNVQCIEEDGASGSGPPKIIADWTFNGTVTDTIERELEPITGFPLANLMFEPGPPQRDELIQFVEGCGMAVNEQFLLDQVDSLFGELLAIRGHLDAAAAIPGVLGRVPAGALGNRNDFPVDVVMVNFTRAAITIVLSLNELLQQYRYTDLDFSQILTLVNPYFDCDSGPMCITTSAINFDYATLALDLNQIFLTHNNPILTGTARALLSDSIDMLKDAMAATPSPGSLINPRQTAATSAAADDIIASLDQLQNSLNNSQDWVLPDTPDYVLHPYRIFDTPFDRDSLRLAVGGMIPGDLFGVQPADVMALENAELELEFLFPLLDELVTLPPDDEPTPRAICVDDNQCPIDKPWQCTGELGIDGFCGGGGASCLSDFDCRPFCDFSQGPGECSDTRSPCSFDPDCWGMNVCVGSVCAFDMVTLCTIDEDCHLPNWRCQFNDSPVCMGDMMTVCSYDFECAPDCIAGSCSNMPMTMCQVPDDCWGTNTCQGVCSGTTNSCRDDYQCAPQCDTMTGLCPDMTTMCFNDFECWGPNVCNFMNSTCVNNPMQSCFSDMECWDPNWRCTNQSCLNNPMQTCMYPEDCFPVNWRCGRNFCEYPEPAFWGPATDDLVFDGDPPLFLDGAVLPNLD